MKTSLPILVAAAILASVGTLWAQRDAASKIDGAAYEAPYFYDTSDMYQQNAYEHARVLQTATSSGVPVPQAVAKEHAAAIRSNLHAARKHIGNLKNAAKDNKNAAKHFEEIDAHHQKAIALADEIDKAAAGDKADAKVINKHATAIADELKASRDKHKRVAEHLKAPAQK